MARGVISAAMCKQRLRLSDEDYRPFRKQCATIARELGIKFKRMCPPETWEIYTRRAMESEYLDAVRPTLGDGKRTSANKATFDALDWILINVLLSAQVEAKRKGEPGGYGSRRSSAVGVENVLHRTGILLPARGQTPPSHRRHRHPRPAHAESLQSSPRAPATPSPHPPPRRRPPRRPNAAPQ
ncbi:hypothetical protein EX30DRAFT_208706 [Ascodesmis nigricans]|uniref:Uncharacterized protein n=1 Tax=Ascodesmis nigricans TaxID=341454 RepID=A0A4S2MJZ3_9PEZI|nr:hypothetical protein EX30DRAFT_208706 [Ascodesmis nigricans]